MRVLPESGPGHRDLRGPPRVGVGRIVDRPADVDSGLQSLDVPAVDGAPAVLVRLRKEEIPHRVESVHLVFVVLVAVPVGVNEHLEVVVVEYDRVALGERGPDVRLLDLRTDVEVRVVPEHLHARPVPGKGARVPLDVREIRGPGSRLP